MSRFNSSEAGWNLIFGAWFVTLIATFGSLFFSEIMKFPPCVLCWYQRICMYPLVLLFLAGMFPLDKRVWRYSLPLALFGWLIALYHNLLHYGIVPESASPCVQGVPCSTVYINWAGFITIPILSLFSFSIILILLTSFLKRIKNEK